MLNYLVKKMSKLTIGAEASVDFQKGIIHMEIDVEPGKELAELEKWKKLLNNAAFNQAKELSQLVKLQKKMG